MTPDFVAYLCNYDVINFHSDNHIIGKLWSGHWLAKPNLIKNILVSNFEKDTIVQILKPYVEGGKEENDQLLHMTIGTLLKFCYQNWNDGKSSLDTEEFLEWPSMTHVANLLHQDSVELNSNIQNPELFLLPYKIFSALCTMEHNLLYLWWYFRCKVIHQRLLEDTSASLYSEIEIIIAKLSNEGNQLTAYPRLQVLLYEEITQAFLMYGRVQKAEEYLNKAKDIAGINLELIGVLGKRTKFQQESLPQLALSCTLNENIERPSAEDSHGSGALPKQMELEDDVRLNKIQYNDSIPQIDLPSLEQTFCLLSVQYLQKAQPKDELINEELLPYIDLVLSQKNGPWSTRVSALLMRCKLEANNKRTVERAMMQCEAIVNHKSDATTVSRLSYLWASGLKPRWVWCQQLADLYLSLGLVKAALEEYQKLQLWEDVIVCYTVMQLRHKAAEVIQQQISVKPTVKLYCLLGDATDDIKCYEKAWQFSNCKSSRAQRHWGNFLFNHKKYDECIPLFEKSLEINSLQENVWLRLGYAALVTEQWEIAGKAYRRYTYLQPNTFEAWNNLAKVYVKQGDKNRAYKALIEALRFNYDNWKLWENVIVVSMDTGHFDDVLRGCHRMLDLQNKFEDVEVLTLLVRVLLQDKADAEGHSALRLLKRVLELFGRITAIHQNKPEIWKLYADISPTNLLKGQRLLKAYRGFAQTGNWSNNPDTCIKVIQLALPLLQYSLNARQEAIEKDVVQADQLLSSARLTAQAVMRAVEKQNWPECASLLEDLQNLFVTVTNYMKSLL